MNWRIAFLISAAVNILVLGAVVGFAAKGGFDQPEPAPVAPAVAPPAEARVVLMNLPPPARTQVRRELARAWMDSQSEREALRAARAETARLVAAEPYDAAAVDAALARQRRASDRVLALFHQRMAAGLGGLDVAQRRAVIAAFLRERVRRDARDDAGASDDDGVAPAPEREAPPVREQLQDRRGELRDRIRERIRERRAERRGE